MWYAYLSIRNPFSLGLYWKTARAAYPALYSVSLGFWWLPWCISFCDKNITVFSSRQVIDERILFWFFLHNALHVRVRQIFHNLKLHGLLDVYPSIHFMNKGSHFQRIYCQFDALKLFGLVWTANNELCRHISKLLVFLRSKISL